MMSVMIVYDDFLFEGEDEKVHRQGDGTHDNNRKIKKFDGFN
jgi:hypothetical protein